MAINYSVIGEGIKTHRDNKGLSQQQLAEMVYVNNQHISRIESGKVSRM